MSPADLLRIRLQERARVRALPGAGDLLRAWNTALILTGDAACSECKETTKRAELDGSGRCEECRT